MELPWADERNLLGGIQQHGGWIAVRAFRVAKAYQKRDERILNDGNFVEEVLRNFEEQLERKFRLKTHGFDFDKVVE
jgi:hypothetical protein